MMRMTRVNRMTAAMTRSPPVRPSWPLAATLAGASTHANARARDACTPTRPDPLKQHSNTCAHTCACGELTCKLMDTEHDGTASHCDFDDSLCYGQRSAGYRANTWRPICCAGAPVPTLLGSSADSHANTFEYHCQCGAPIVADSRPREVCAELVMAALPESGR